MRGTRLIVYPALVGVKGSVCIHVAGERRGRECIKGRRKVRRKGKEGREKEDDDEEYEDDDEEEMGRRSH